MSEVIEHENPYFSVVRESFSSVGGPSSYWGVRKSDFAMVLAEQGGRFAVLHAFRPLIGRDVLEFPQGALEDREDPEDAARRELAEETGLTVGRLSQIGSLHESYGLTASKCFVFRGEINGTTRATTDVNEQVRSVRMLSMGPLVSGVRAGHITDAITIAALVLVGL